MRRLFVSLVLLLTAPALLRATVLVPIELRQLVAASSTIVHGRVVDVHAEWIDGRRSLETFVTVAADEYLKGGLGDTVTIHVPGGQLGRYRTIFVGAPVFREGEEVILFLRGGPAPASIVGLSQGAYRVAPDSGGRSIVTSPIVMGRADTEDAGRIVRGDARQRPMSVAAFGDLVRRLAGGGR